MKTIKMVRMEGLEPPRLAAPEPKSGASTNFATPAHRWRIAAASSRVSSKAICGMRVENAYLFQ